MAGGYFKIWRSFFDDLIMHDPVAALLFVVICGRANWTKTEVYITGKAGPVSLERGQLLTGRHSLHETVYPGYKKKKNREYAASPSTLWRRLEWLQTKGAVSLKTGSKYTIVTIANYATYQDSEVDGEQRVNSGCTAGEQRVNTDKKEQESKEQLRTVKNSSLSSGEPDDEGDQSGSDDGDQKPDPRLAIEKDFLECWKKTKGVTGIRKFNASRRSKFRTRLKDSSWEWREALDEFPLKTFEGKPEGAWQPNVDWFLQPNTVNKILEGNYDKTIGGKANDRIQPGAVHDESTAGTQITF